MGSFIQRAVRLLLFFSLISLSIVILRPTMLSSLPRPSVLSLLLPVAAQAVDLDWYAPAQTNINNLTTALNSNGVYGFIFNSSTTPNSEYGTYNWCNMPHVRKTEYVKADNEYELKYVEVVNTYAECAPKIRRRTK
jgi:hypothetical protein